MVVRPEQIAENRCVIWEERIDSQLKNHDWDGSLQCTVKLVTTSPHLEALLDRYRQFGWGVQVKSVGDDGCTISFELHDSWVEKKGKKLSAHVEGMVVPA